MPGLFILCSQIHRTDSVRYQKVGYFYLVAHPRVNIFDMGDGKFLFQFASKMSAEQVMKGRWQWKNNIICFQSWWPLIGGLLKDRPSTVWTRVVGLPHMFVRLGCL